MKYTEKRQKAANSNVFGCSAKLPKLRTRRFRDSFGTFEKRELRRLGYDADKLPRGQVLCVVEMYDCEELPRGLYGWKLGKKKLKKQVRVRGRLGLWELAIR